MIVFLVCFRIRQTISQTIFKTIIFFKNKPVYVFNVFKIDQITYVIYRLLPIDYRYKIRSANLLLPQKEKISQN